MTEQPVRIRPPTLPTGRTRRIHPACDTFLTSKTIGLPMPRRDFDSDDDLMTPREVAEMLGVRTATVGLWARIGALKSAMRTPGGHRRFRRADVRTFRDGREQVGPSPERERMVRDAVLLYDQGWSIRRVAAHFECDYGSMRRILLNRTAVRGR